MDTALLLKRMKELSCTRESLASHLGIDRTTLYRKLSKDGEKFTVKEVNVIKKVLNLSEDEAILIFFKD